MTSVTLIVLARGVVTTLVSGAISFTSVGSVRSPWYTGITTDTLCT
jgi:hypothetical protein